MIGHFGASLLDLGKDSQKPTQFNNPVSKEVLNRAKNGVKVDICIVAPSEIKDRDEYTFQDNFRDHLKSVKYAQTFLDEAKKSGVQENIAIRVFNEYPPFTGDLIDLSSKEKAKLTIHPTGYHHHFRRSIHFMMDPKNRFVTNEKQDQEDSAKYIDSVDESVEEMKKNGYTITSKNIEEYVKDIEGLGKDRESFKKGFESLLSKQTT